MNINELRAGIRTDLKDEDMDNYLWTDAELDRHIFHALYDFSIAVPAESRAELHTTPGSRELSLSGLCGLISVAAVEYPAGNYPQTYVRFSLWENILMLLIDNIPGSNEPVNVYFLKQHTIDAQGSSIPPGYEDTIATGAVAYATFARANYSIDRTNTGGEQVSGNYLELAKIRLDEFKTRLAMYNRKNAVRMKQFYIASD